MRRKIKVRGERMDESMNKGGKPVTIQMRSEIGDRPGKRCNEKLNLY